MHKMITAGLFMNNFLNFNIVINLREDIHMMHSRLHHVYRFWPTKGLTKANNTF